MLTQNLFVCRATEKLVMNEAPIVPIYQDGTARLVKSYVHGLIFPTTHYEWLGKCRNLNQKAQLECKVQVKAPVVQLKRPFRMSNSYESARGEIQKAISDVQFVRKCPW